MAQELAQPDDAPITPGSRRRRPRRIAAAAEDSDGEGAVTPAAADEIAAELTRLATTCSSDGTPTGPRHGGADDASRPWHGGRGLARAEAEAEAEPDPTQIHVHELKIAPQPRHVSSCLRAGHRGRGQRQTGDALPGPLTRQSQPRRPQARPTLRCRAHAYPKPVVAVALALALAPTTTNCWAAFRCKLGWRDFVARDGRAEPEPRPSPNPPSPSP